MSAGERARGGRGGEPGGFPGRAVVCAGVGAGGYGAWRGVLYMVWAWRRLDLHGATIDTCGSSWCNSVNEISFLSIFCMFCIWDILWILCTGYQLIGMP
jgi:hypothetical protein